MHVSRRTAASALAATALAASSLAAAAPATAGPFKGSYDPNVTRTAWAKTSCKSIIGSIRNAEELLGTDIDFKFAYGRCLSTLRHKKAFIEPAEEFGSPYKQCRAMVAEGFPLPYVFYAGDTMEEQLLPDLEANNIRQCGNALYAFHTIFTAVGPHLPPPPSES